MKQLNKLFSVVAVSAVLFSGAVQAAVSLAEAEKLKNELTPYGAERAGNDDGSIPAWTGGITEPPAGLGYEGDGDHHPDPYADDKVLYKITKDNMAQYSDQLSTGIQAMLEQYGDSFFLNVYNSRRSHAAPKWVYDNTFTNATKASLAAEGNGVNGAYAGIPFPIPKTGQEVIWNHLMRYNGLSRSMRQHWFQVEANGNKSEVYADSSFLFPYYDKDGSIESWNGDIMLVNFEYLYPSRRKGEYVLFRDPANQVDNKRNAWRYLPGARRVRRAPTLSYDTPMGPSGSRTVDDTRMFNGAIDRYNWTLVGKQEMYVPYNTYKLEHDSVKLDTLLTSKHLNPDYMRYEKHRVWVVDAELKEGKRHVYGKRRFYIDEDSWVALLSDTYDNRGNLWRVSVNPVKNLYEAPLTDGKSLVIHDLQTASYQALGMHNDDPSYMKTQIEPIEDKYFTPSALRKRARR